MRTETLELHLKNLRSLRRLFLREAKKLEAESLSKGYAESGQTSISWFVMRNVVTDIDHVRRRLELVLYLQKERKRRKDIVS